MRRLAGVLVAVPRLSRVLGALAACVVALSAAVPQAQGAFPGRNGRLAMSALTTFPEDPPNVVLWDYSRRTGKLRQLTPGPSGCRADLLNATEWFDFGLDYSPDGRWIAYLHADNCPGGHLRSGLWIMRADGRANRQLASFKAAGLNIFRSDAAFSPDGRAVAVVRDLDDGQTANYGLTVFGVPDGAIQRQSALGPFAAPSGLDWGTNGRLAAVLSNRTGAYRLYAMAPDGSRRRRVYVKRPGYWEDAAPDWSPRSAGLAFVGTRWVDDDVVGQAIWRAFPARARGSRLTRRGMPHSPAFSPNGRRIAFIDGFGERILSRASNGRDTTSVLMRTHGRVENIESISWQPRPR